MSRLRPWQAQRAIYLAGSPLTGIARSVLWVLCGHARAGGCLCWPGDRLVAAETGFCERAVRAAREELRERGLIDWRHVTTRRGRGNVYHLNWPALEALAAACGNPVEILCKTGPEVVENPVENEGGSGTTCRMGPAPHAGRVRHLVPGKWTQGTDSLELDSVVVDDDEVSQCEAI